MNFINYLEGITGIGIFPLVSLLVFFFFFIALGIYLFKADKAQLKHLAALPVEDSLERDQTNDQKN